MNQWKDMEDKIRKATENEPIPESLSPEIMEQKLKIKEAEIKEKKARRFDKNQFMQWGRVAVVFGLIFAICLSISLINSGIRKDSAYGDDCEEAVSDNVKAEELVEKIPGSDSYDAVYAKIKDIQKEQRGGFFENLVGDFMSGGVKGESTDGAMPESSVEMPEGDLLMDDAVEEYSSNVEDSLTNKHSTTNLQEEGVGEADVVITDGEYLYIQRQEQSVIAIVKAQGTEMETVSELRIKSTEVGEDINLAEFYVNKDRLYAMASLYTFENNENREETLTIVYDISDRSNPKEISKLSQSGSYHSSRMTGGYLYVFSDHYIYEEIRKEEPGTFVPLVCGEPVACEDICMPENVDDCHYKVITSLEMNNPAEFVENQSVLCGSGFVYVSQKNIYFTSGDGKETEIWKFTYQDGKIVGTATGSVKGSVSDQFAFSEANGYFRVVTTYDMGGFFNQDDQRNGLFVFDENLAQVGAIEDLAPGEQIYSARFFANMAYFVTFRQTDPLFSVDLSDPTNPKLLGELKIPGFSEYLHPYGDGLLLGIGYDADENGSQTGIKLTMFDVSDPSNVKEADTMVISEFSTSGNAYKWGSCSAMYNHKKVLIDVEKNIIGFQLEENEDVYINSDYRCTFTNTYVVYGYDAEQGFYQKMKDGYVDVHDAYMYSEDMNKEGEICGEYINHYLYAVNRKYQIRVYDMDNSFAKVGEYNY